jgi:hypothetical protein
MVFASEMAALSIDAASSSEIVGRDVPAPSLSGMEISSRVVGRSDQADPLASVWRTLTQYDEWMRALANMF